MTWLGRSWAVGPRQAGETFQAGGEPQGGSAVPRSCSRTRRTPASSGGCLRPPQRRGEAVLVERGDGIGTVTFHLIGWRAANDREPGSVSSKTPGWYAPSGERSAFRKLLRQANTTAHPM